MPIKYVKNPGQTPHNDKRERATAPAIREWKNRLKMRFASAVNIMCITNTV
ncbi:hypothetical protein [Paraburkholderia sp. BL6669N2]|uniref:hypothetical protein n=1 Tax=Paraburkholderia sp. BL6669N2 TaxID=1938807 RepID=UPI00216392BB|nr:hypothetical protein [Paraburkholderia sp. BL6669N2]